MRYIEKNIATNTLAIEAQLLLNKARHYNENDRVKEIIRLLYSGCCAFCECSPEDGSFFQIEHFYPKNSARHRRFIKSIENLHYSCQRCNTLKGRRVHQNIFSPNYFLNNVLNWQITGVAKIESELFYIGHLLFSFNSNHTSTDRGNETIKLFDLNNFNGAIRSSRQFLVESRLKLYKTVFDIVNVIYELLLNYAPTNNKAIEILFSTLIKFTNKSTHYSTMIIHNFGAEIHKLLTIYLYKRK